MTNDEIKEATFKFIEYLEANGVHVLCHAMYVDEDPLGEISVAGSKEMLLIAAVHKHGWEVVPR